MCSKIKLVYLEIVISVVIGIYTLNTVASDAGLKSKSFRKCLAYKEVNGTIDDLISIDVLSDKIVGGGYDANPEELPFMAALGYGNETQIKYFCGGTLISDQFVLTAAHCIFSRTWGPARFVRLGDLNLQLESDNDGVQMFTVQDYHIHPNYKYPLKYHDIALIKLDKPVEFSSTVLPACLDFSRDRLQQNHLYVAGWGRTGYGEEQSDHLQVARVVKYNISECQKTFTKELTLPSGVIDESQICAGAGLRLTDTCDGDSGGPLGHSYLLRENTIDFVIGVTSFGKTCLQGKIPAVYTRVSSYTNWIESILWPKKTDKILFPID